MHLNIDVRGAEDVPAKGHGPGHCVAWKIHGMFNGTGHEIEINFFRPKRQSVMRKEVGREGGKRSQKVSDRSDWGLSFNFAVVFDFALFPVPPSKAHD